MQPKLIVEILIGIKVTDKNKHRHQFPAGKEIDDRQCNYVATFHREDGKGREGN